MDQSLINVSLCSFISTLYLLYSNALYLLVFVSQRLLFAVESGGTVSYLDETLKKALLHIRRLFDKFIVNFVVLLSSNVSPNF